MRFLGLAAGYKFRDVLRHLFAVGNLSDFLELRRFLYRHYVLENVQRRGRDEEFMARVGDLTKNGEEARVFLYDNGRTALARAVRGAMRAKGNVLVEGDGERVENGPAGIDNGFAEGGKPKVVVNGLTCYAVVQGVVAAGCEPIYADIEAGNLNFSAEKLAEILAVERDVVAVVVQNNLGNLVEIEEIAEVTKRFGVILIEDLAHSMGLVHKSGMESGMTGDAVVLSFGKGKAADVCGGGAVILVNEKMCGDEVDEGYEKTKVRRVDINMVRDKIYPLVGWCVRGWFGLRLAKVGKGILAVCMKVDLVRKSADGGVDFGKRMSFWQAKLLMRKLRRREFFLLQPLRRFYLVREREKVLTELEKNGFYGPDFWYERPVSPERYYRIVNFPEEKCPVAVKVAERIVNLPMNLNVDELSKFEEIIKKYEVKLDNEK